MADSTFFGLRSEDFWEIYESENPLAEALRRIASIGREEQPDELPHLLGEWEGF
jgi:hypothetical protein